jgi:response regulator RpfG family c-di-GMP phosphodiesterase
MASDHLAGCRLLIVEDEYYLADDAQMVLTEVGADVLGPVATIKAAEALVASEPRIDGVLLDVNLRGELAFDFADALHTRGIPFVFVTGYDQAMVPERFADAPRLQKPVSGQELVRLLGSIACGTASPAGS